MEATTSGTWDLYRNRDEHSYGLPGWTGNVAVAAWERPGSPDEKTPVPASKLSSYSFISAPPLSLSLPAEKAAREPEKKSYLKTWVNAGTSRVFAGDEDRETANHLAVGLIKTTGLVFFSGKLGLAASLVLGGLDQARPDGSWKEQVTDFVLGGAKSVTMKKTLSVLGPQPIFAPLKGALIGLALGTTSEVFKRQTFSDPASLPGRLEKSTFNMEEIFMNAAVSAAGEGLNSSLKATIGSKLESHRLLTSMLMGSTFGIVTGTAREARRQVQEKQAIDPIRMLRQGILDGSVSATGIAAGLTLSDLLPPVNLREAALNALDSQKFNPYMQRIQSVLKGDGD